MQGRRGLRRKMREERERQRKLTLRHRWYAGGIATLLSGALIFAGVGPAVADTTTPPPADDTTSQETPPAEESTPPADETTPPADESTPPADESTPPADESTPPADESTPPAEETDAPDDESSDAETDTLSSRLAPSDDAVTLDDGLVQALAGGGGTTTPPGANEVLFNITKGGNRTGATAIAPLQGAVFAAYQATGLNTGLGASPVETCTTDVNGQCWMKVPTRGGTAGAANQGYYVKELAPAPATPAANFRVIDTMAYSYGGLSVSGTTPYGFYTGAVGSSLSTANRTFALPSSTNPSLTNGDGVNARQTSGVWANARNNPVVPAQCGLNVALLVDLSSSVQQAGGQAQVRNAATGLVDALTGTPSQLAIYTFGTNSPAPSVVSGSTVNVPGYPGNPVNANVPLQSVATTSAAAFLRAKAQNLTADNIGTQYTNWDGGLWALQPLASNLDAVIVLTDGMPTKYGPGATASGGANTRFIEMENAIASANAIRSAGAKIITFGVGNGASGNAFHNLAAISGPVPSQDYYQTAWQDVAAAIKALADNNCQGTVNVTKQVVPVGGTFPGSAAAVSGWNFNVSAPAATVRVDTTGSSYVSSLTAPTGATGVLGLRSLFSGTTPANRVLSITETPGSTYTLRPWSVAEGGHTAGDNARCVTTAAPNTAIDITNIGSTGFTVAPQQDATISCIVVNQAVDTTARLQVNKIWRIDTNGDGQYEQVTQPNVAQTLIPGLGANLVLGGNAGIPGTGPWNFGQLYANLGVNSTVAVSETIDNLPVLCTNVATYSPALTGGLTTLTMTSTQGTNVVNVTNTVTCQSRLTLEKSISGGSAPLTDWTLDAIAPGGALAGPNGTNGSAGATAPVTANTVYPMAETANTPAAQNYTQRWEPSLQDQWLANRTAGATGSWICVQATSVTGGVPTWAINQYDGRNGGVTVGIGGWSKCTAVNDPKPTLQLVKKVSLNGVETVVPVGTSSWTLSADWSALTSGESGGTDGITPNPVTQSPDPVTNPGGFAARSVSPGHYTLTETGTTTGYTNGTSFSCSINGGAATTVNVNTAIQLETGQAAVCTIVNTRQTGTLSIVKAIDNPQAVTAGKVFSGTYTCSDSNPQSKGDWTVTGAGTATLTPTTGSLQIPTGTTCTVAEVPSTPTGGLVDASWQWGPATYTQPGPIAVSPTATATVTNHASRVYGAITVTKSLVGAPATFSGTFTGSWSCDYPLNAPDDTNGTWSVAFTNGVGAATTYTGPRTQIPLTSACTVTENTGGSLPGFSDPSYTWASNTVAPSVATPVTNPQTPVAFTVTNTAQRSSLQLSKLVQNPNGGGAVATDWNQKLQATPSTGPALLFNHQQIRFVAPGTYTLAEINQLVGYQQSNLTCSVGTLVGSVVTVAPGQAAACVFTNTDVAPTLTLVKNVDNDNGVGSSFADEWTLNATPDVQGAPAISGKGSPADQLQASISGPVRGGVEYTLSESNGPSGYTEGTWSCFITGTDDEYEMETANSVVPEVGTNVTCEITNTAVPAEGTIVKRVVTGYPQQNTDGTWTIVYEVVVTNNSSTSTFFYDLDDTLMFGGGITPDLTSSTWTDPTGGSHPFDSLTETFATNASIPASGSHTYTVTVNADIADGTQDGQTWLCSTAVPTPAAGGFLNSATMAVDGEDDVTVYECEPPAFPTIEKEGTNPAHQNDDASFDIEYTITVTNPSAIALQATVSDGFPNVPNGWTLAGGKWTVAAVAGAPIGGTTQFDPGTEGEIWSGTLPANTSYQYTVTGNLTPTADATPIGDCEARGGLTNDAAVTSGDVVVEDDGCVTVLLPAVTVTKTAASVQQLDGGNWQIDYTIQVDNTSTATATVYTLTDLPQLGTGFDVVSEQWVGTAPVANTPIGLSGTPEGTHQYTYRVVASFNPETEDPELVCSPQETGAFSNMAAIVFPGGTDDDVACAEPKSPTVTKTAGAVTQNGAEWLLSYTVTVTNGSSIPLWYSLDDSPSSLPAGATATTAWAVDGPAALNGGTFTGPSTPWNGDPDTTVGTGTLPAGASHVFTVTVGVTLADDVDPDALLCGEEPGDDGFWNTAVVTNGVGESEASDCAEIESPELTIEKADANVSQNADLEWILTYVVTVTNESDAYAAQYELADTPQFGSNFDVVPGSEYWSAGNTPGAPSGQTTPPTGSVPAGGTVTWTYHVKATVNEAGFDPETAFECSTTDEVPGGGFYNVATVFFPGGNDQDGGCGVPATPEVTKTTPATSPQEGGAWVLTYTVTVTNPSDITLGYELDDTPAALPAGASLATPWTITGPQSLNGGTFTASTPAWDGDANIAVGDGTLPAGAVHVFEVTASVTLGTGTLPADLVCGQGPNSGDGFWNNAYVYNGVGEDSADACTTVTPPQLSIVKDDGTVTQLADGSWQIDYIITVTNATNVQGAYTLTDTPDLGDGWSWDAPGSSWRDPADVSLEGPAPIPNQPIAANDSDTYVYRVIADVVEGSEPSVVCDDEEGGAFFNTATIVYAGGTDSDNGCAEPASPNVVKTAQPATFDAATGLWTLTYKVEVLNTTGIQLAYHLTDDAAELPTGVSGGTWTASGPTVENGDANDAGVLVDGWAGSGALADGVITGDATHVYYVTRTVSVAADAAVDDLTCGETSEDGGGAWNSTSVTNGVGTDDDEACITIDRPTVTVDKTVTSTTQGPDGVWTITYDVTVENDSDTLPAQYDLTDEILFGEGIEIVTDAGSRPSWSGPTGSGEFDAPDYTTATFATGRVVGAGLTDTYTVTVKAQISADAWTNQDSVLTCAEEGSLDAGGFLNSATATAGGTTETADDCSEPKLPTVAKTGVSAAQDPEDPDQWLVSYTVTVTGSEYASFYTLKDNPGYPDGVTVSDGTAQRTGDATVYDIESGEEFPYDAEGDPQPVAIGANEVQTWTVTWIATIPGDIDPTLGECGEVPEPKHGFYNQVQLLQGGEPVDEGDTCIPVEDKVYPTVTKTVTSTSQDAETGLWTIVYQLQAKLAPTGPENPKGLSAKYDLTDELQFGGDIEIDFDETGWTGPLGTSGTFANDGTATLADDRPIPQGGTHTYTVTVVADVLEAAIDEGTTECYPDNEDPAGGFLNTATLTSGGQREDADDCSEPVLPEIEKTGTGSTQNEDGSWTITYDVTVSYPETDQDPLPSPVGFTLTDAPDLPTGVTLKDGTSWTATATDGGPIDNPTWDGADPWTIVEAGELVVDPESDTLPSYTYEISATVVVTAEPEGDPETCRESEDDGIVIINEATVTSGNHEATDDGCDVVHYDDVEIVKTSELPGEQTSVAPGDVFDYILTVTNHGTRPATNVHVTDDDLNDRLQINGLEVAPGSVTWGPAPGYEGNDVDLTIDELGVGESATITITVEFLPADQELDPFVNPGQQADDPAAPLDELTNTACVDADYDSVEENNCDDEEIPARDITATLYATCVSDAPLLGWIVRKSELLRDEPIDFTWTPDFGTPATEPLNVTLQEPGGNLVWANLIEWPGTAFTPGGIAVDYPGWRVITRADVVPGSDPLQFYLPGTTTVMTPEQEAEFVYNGLILDPSTLDYAWRQPTTITFSVNPELVYSADYPAATPECFQARHSDVQIVKNASVEKTEPGKSFDYTMDVANVSDDSAAAGVVVTDAIPADLKVNSVTWDAMSDGTLFPNWQSCDVTGKNAAGYGGTLTCKLFGPLMPADFEGGGRSAAPQLVVNVTVNPASKASVITNVGVVDYYTFGDPEDPGRDSDDATVLLSALPVTGGTPAWPLVMLGFLALLGGVGTLVVMRRRKGEANAEL